MATISEDIAREIGLSIIKGIPDIDIANNLCNGNISIVRGIAYGNTWQHLFSDEERKLIELTRKGNIISIEDKHELCRFYENNKNYYSGYGSTSKLVSDAMKSIGLDSDDIRKFRVAKRLYYRYESPEITCLYNY